MRVINLDETGIKLLNSKKKQIYLNKDELIDFVNGKYTIVNNNIIFNEKSLPITDDEIKDFPVILKYLKSSILKK